MIVNREYNFVYLLVAILLLIVVSPVIDYFWRWPEFRPQGLFFAATLLVAVFSIQGSRIVLVTGACLVLITLISVGLALGKPDTGARGVITLLASVDDEIYGVCRRVRVSNEARGRKRGGVYKACKATNGT